MLVLVCGTPTWRPENRVKIWNLLWLSRTLISSTEQTSIKISTFPILERLKWLKSRDKYTLFNKRDRSCMSRTAITLKFKIRWFPNEGRY